MMIGAVSCAELSQTLGLHMRNATPTLSAVQRTWVTAIATTVTLLFVILLGVAA
jgi:hypothetical protein